MTENEKIQSHLDWLTEQENNPPKTVHEELNDLKIQFKLQEEAILELTTIIANGGVSNV